MGKKSKILIFVFIAAGIIYFSGILSPLNSYFEKQSPDTSCIDDTDCGLAMRPPGDAYCTQNVECRTMDASSPAVIALNKNWRPFCPFPTNPVAMKVMCIGGVDSAGKIQLRCIGGKCMKFF